MRLRVGSALVRFRVRVRVGARFRVGVKVWVRLRLRLRFKVGVRVRVGVRVGSTMGTSGGLVVLVGLDAAELAVDDDEVAGVALGAADLVRVRVRVGVAKLGIPHQSSWMQPWCSSGAAVVVLRGLRGSGGGVERCGQRGGVVWRQARGGVWCFT